jgi:hypothetical protein
MASGQTEFSQSVPNVGRDELLSEEAWEEVEQMTGKQLKGEQTDKTGREIEHRYGTFFENSPFGTRIKTSDGFRCKVSGTDDLY